MNKLLIGGAMAALGFIGKLFIDITKEEKAQQEKSKAQAEEYERARIEWEIEQKRIESERIRLLPKITTSSNNYIKGYKIVRHIRMVSINDENHKTIAEGKFLLAVEEAGGNGVINMQVRPHRGGYFSVQGDAVLIEPV
jgi:hypothetical protein